MDLLNNFNGISLAVIMILSYCAVLKSTQRHERWNKQQNEQIFNRKYR